MKFKLIASFLIAGPIVVFSLLANAGTSEGALSTLSFDEGQQLTERCVWAPNDASVCRARTACSRDVLSAKCAKYCRVNPYDVVCGDKYRRPALPYRRQPPYPWAVSRPFCVEHRYLAVCQDGWPHDPWRY